MLSWILLGIYVLVFAVFMTSIVIEAPKHGASVGAFHVIVALFWPLWILWYGWLVITNKYETWRKKRKK